MVQLDRPEFIHTYRRENKAGDSRDRGEDENGSGVESVYICIVVRSRKDQEVALGTPYNSDNFKYRSLHFRLWVTS